MINNTSKSRRSLGLRLTIITLAIAIIAGLLIWAVVVELNKENSPYPTKEELTALVEGGYPAEAKNIAEALSAWGFVNFDKNALVTVEHCYKSHYYTSIDKSDAEIACGTATGFIEDAYDIVDLSESESVTNALANCYIRYGIGDKYGEYRTKTEQEIYSDDMSGQLVGIGITVTKTEDNGIIVNSTLNGSPAEKAGVLAGDIITAVDGELISKVGYSKGVNLIRGEEGSQVVIRVLRLGTEADITVTRQKVVESTVFYEMLEGRLGYIQITRFKANTAEQFTKALDTLVAEGAEGILFDLRSNPGGLLSAVTDMLSYLAPSGTEIASFSSTKETVVAKHGTELEKTDNIYTLPCVVLIDNFTASAGELFTAGVRDFSEMGFFDAVIAGQKSFGKGVMQSNITFTDGSALTITTALYNPPSGVNYNDIGISPDEGKDFPPEKDQIALALTELKALIASAEQKAA